MDMQHCSLQRVGLAAFWGQDSKQFTVNYVQALVHLPACGEEAVQRRVARERGRSVNACAAQDVLQG